MSIFNKAFNNPPSPPEDRLRYAVLKNDIKTVQDLIKKGVDINAQDRQGFTPLIIAARHGRAMCARVLLGHGAEIDKKDYKGNSALLWAAFHGYGEVVDVLLEKGADIDARGKNGTALTCAVYFQREGIVSALLRHGANLEKKDPNGNTAMSLARKNGNEDIGRMLHEVMVNRTQNRLREAARRKPRPKFKP